MNQPTLTPEQLKEARRILASIGGNANKKKYGNEYYKKMAIAREENKRRARLESKKA